MVLFEQETKNTLGFHLFWGWIPILAQFWAG